MAKILLVEDDVDSRRALQAALGGGHFEVLAASSTDAALGQLGRTQFEAVIADYWLDKRSGVWLLSEVKRRQPNALRVLITGDPRLDLQRLTTRGICHFYLTKPFAMRELIDLLTGVPQGAIVTDYTPVADV